MAKLRIELEEDDFGGGYDFYAYLDEVLIATDLGYTQESYALDAAYEFVGYFIEDHLTTHKGNLKMLDVMGDDE